MNEKVIRSVMLIAGVLTCTMIYAAIAPGAAMQKNFGTALTNPAMELVVRNWGALIFMVGAMLVYGAFRPAVRSLVLFAAAASKVVFITLLVTLGRAYLAGPLYAAVVIDSIEVVLFVAMLMTARRA